MDSEEPTVAKRTTTIRTRTRTTNKARSGKRKRGQNEGTVYRRADGRWEARLTLPDGAGRKSLFGKTRADAYAQLVAAQRDLELGLPVRADERLTVGQFLRDWLLTKQPPQVEPKTARRYRELLTLHVIPTLGETRLTKLSAQQAQALYQAKLAEGLSSTTVRKVHMCLHAALESALRLGLVSRNVTELVDKPKNAPRDIHPFTREQSRQLLEAARGDRLEALYVLALSTGMRLGELLGLRWEDIEMEGGRPDLQVRQIAQRGGPGEGIVFKRPKTPKSRRRIALAPVAVEALRAHRARQLAERLRLGAAWGNGLDGVDLDLVFPNVVGRPYEGEHVYARQFLPLVRRAGLPERRFHDLRHTAATLLLGARVNPKVVSEMLGHASVSTTLDLYAHVLPDMQQDAAAVMQRLLVLEVVS